MAAAISSGSFQTIGMVVAPCSMKSLAQIALALDDNLLARAADVTLKERRKLVVVPRETPLNLSHLRHMVAITEMGGVILPPAPSFYHTRKPSPTSSTRRSARFSTSSRSSTTSLRGGRAMPAAELEARCLDLLTGATTMTLASCADNVPWATDVYFVSVGFDLWFVSSANSRHSANLKENPACSATVHVSARDWKAIRGLQFAGKAVQASATDALGLLGPYFKKFPFAEAVAAGLNARTRASALAVYRIAVERVWYIDNSLGFGTKYTAEVDGGRVGAFHEV